MAEIDLLWFLADPIIGTAIILIVGIVLGSFYSKIRDFFKQIQPMYLFFTKDKRFFWRFGKMPGAEYTWTKDEKTGEMDKTKVTKTHYVSAFGRPVHIIAEGEPANIDLFKKTKETQSSKELNQLVLGGVAYGQNMENLLTSAPVQMNNLYVILIVTCALSAVLSGVLVAKQFGLLDF